MKDLDRKIVRYRAEWTPSGRTMTLWIRQGQGCRSVVLRDLPAREHTHLVNRLRRSTAGSLGQANVRQATPPAG